MHKTLTRIVTMIAASASVLAAQAGTQPRRPAPPAGGAGQPTVMQPGRGDRQMDRRQLPDSLRRKQMQGRMGDLLKQRFGLSDAQVTKFGETNKKFAERARLIGEQDRDLRMAMRDEMLRPDSARSSLLSALLDKQAAVRRQRAELADARDKELASFLTPLQRAKLSNARGAMRNRGGMGGGQQGMRGMRRPDGMNGQMGPGMRRMRRDGMQQGAPGMQGMQGMQGPPRSPDLPRGRRPDGDGSRAPVDP